ncbi:MAG: S-adenosylmethionine:tRNA ribosyltransferase-isomerase, partial [Acidobacteria bacterium]|nr:S-adenosylmethionine:tRNA ribosyltransferase-isomerase [Acidobacteriota bacterium]
MLRSDFSFDLPPELIAQNAGPRGGSRLLVMHTGEKIEHRSFDSFPDLVGPGDVVVLNDTAVFPARLFAAPKGNMKNPIELFLTRRVAPLRWEAMARPLRRLRAGDALSVGDLRVMVVERTNDGVVVQFELPGEEEFWQAMEQLGQTPLPPYIHREQPVEGDRERYQTVYADRRGAVAAPTAGLHFTREILDRVR